MGEPSYERQLLGSGFYSLNSTTIFFMSTEQEFIQGPGDDLKVYWA